MSIAVGIFGVSEILRNLQNESAREVGVKKVSGLWLTRDEFRGIIGPVVRGTGLGSLLGILPGGGHVLASFASYSAEKNLSKHPEELGHGAIEGVAGPESANNAAAQTSFIPLLTLGIPAHPVMALIVGALILQGIQPGPNVITTQPELFWGIIASMWIGNLLLIVLNLPLIDLWVKLLSIPYRALFAAIGCYSINNNPFDVYAIIVFGLLGYLVAAFGSGRAVPDMCPPAKCWTNFPASDNWLVQQSSEELKCIFLSWVQRVCWAVNSPPSWCGS